MLLHISISLSLYLSPHPYTATPTYLHVVEDVADLVAGVAEVVEEVVLQR